MQDLSGKQRIGVKLVRIMSAAFFSALALRKRNIRVDKKEFRYGPHPDERLDYLQPGSELRESQEAIIYLHGGGWISCSKRYYPPDLQFLCDAGYTVFNLEYPLAPENPHPNIMLSVMRAVTWIKQHYRDIDRFHMMGDSAGANLATMYAVLFKNPELLDHFCRGYSQSELLSLESVISLYGLLDRGTILGDEPGEVSSVVKLFLQSYGGLEALQPGPIAPEHAITPMDLDWGYHPPCFLGVGDIDFLFRSSDLYARVLKNRGVPVTYRIYPGAPHGFFNMRHAETPALKQDVLKFLDAL